MEYIIIVIFLVLIANEYDAQYEGLHKAVLPVILDKMTFVPDTDVLVDLGSGTGRLAHNIMKQAKLKHTVICVEPSESMVSIASNLDGLTIIQATAQEFASNKTLLSNLGHFNKALIAFCSHHFADSLKSLFSTLAESLPEGGLILIIDRLRDTALPLFKAALEKHQQAHANDLSSQQYSALVEPLGFVVDSCEVTLEYTMTKKLWYRMLRERFMSYLHQLTDEQIEDGIKELEVKFHDNYDILVKDSVIFHKLVKS